MTEFNHPFNQLIIQQNELNSLLFTVIVLFHPEWSTVQMICMWSSGCQCNPIISCFVKIQNGLPFWCRLTQVVLEKAVKQM